MPSRVDRDPELRYFADRLSCTSEGKRYTLRWRQAEDTRRAIQTALKNGAPETTLQLLRHAYIRQTNQCSDALGALQIEYSWPECAARTST